MPTAHAMNRPCVTADTLSLLLWMGHSEREDVDVFKEVILPGDAANTCWPSEDQARGVVGVQVTLIGKSNSLFPEWAS